VDACRDAKLNALRDTIAHKCQHPTNAGNRKVTCVFRDSAFENDEAKTNLAAILSQHGIHHVRSL
jgi:adenine-specific DNA-methyltransferase